MCKHMWLQQPDGRLTHPVPRPMLNDSWGFWPLSFHQKLRISPNPSCFMPPPSPPLRKKTFPQVQGVVLGNTSVSVLNWNFSTIRFLTPVLPWFSAPISLQVTSCVVLGSQSQTWGWSRMNKEETGGEVVGSQTVTILQFMVRDTGGCE